MGGGTLDDLNKYATDTVLHENDLFPRMCF